MAKKSKKKGKKTSKKSKGSALSDVQDIWESAEARTGGVPLEDGTYTGVIENALIEKSRNGRLQVRWDLLVTEGDSEGRQIRKYEGLETEENLGWFKGDLETLEVDVPEDINDLGDALEAACGLAIVFRVKSKDDFVNVYFNELVEGGGEEDNDSGDEDEVTAADVKKMSKDDLNELAEEYGLDPDDYDTKKELVEAVIEELD
jgi:hypothetical protein